MSTPRTQTDAAACVRAICRVRVRKPSVLSSYRTIHRKVLAITLAGEYLRQIDFACILGCTFETPYNLRLVQALRPQIAFHLFANRPSRARKLPRHSRLVLLEQPARLRQRQLLGV